MLDDLATSVRLAGDALMDALTKLEDVEKFDDVEHAHRILLVAKETTATLRGVNDLLMTKIGEQIGPDKQIINGVPVKRHAKVSRTKWDSDDLLRVVKDSRWEDPDTGEIVTGLDLIARVYPLKGYNAKVTALREIGVDPDEFCRSEFRGWTLADR